MLHHTHGISLHTTKFSETSGIVKIYTELFGIQSYMVKGIRKQNARLKAALFQPLTLLDMVVYHKEISSIQNLKEAVILHPYTSIPFDIRKSSLALFINELIYKSILEEEPQPELFRFLQSTCLELDSLEKNLSLFHLLFAIRLTKYLGFMPQTGYSAQAPYFDLREGVFQSSPPAEYTEYLDPEISAVFARLLATPEGLQANFQIPPETRDLVLEKILLYYQIKVPGFRQMKSHLILKTVLG